MDKAIVDLGLFFAVQHFVPLTDPQVLQLVRTAFVVASGVWWFLLQDLPARAEAASDGATPIWVPVPKKPTGMLESLFPPPPPAADASRGADEPLPDTEYEKTTLAAHESALAKKLRDGALLACAQPVIFSFALNIHIMLALALFRLPLMALRDSIVRKHLLGLMPAAGERLYGELLRAPPPPAASESEADGLALEADDAVAEDGVAEDEAGKDAGKGPSPAVDASTVAECDPGVPEGAVGARPATSSALRARRGRGVASGAGARVFNLESEEAVLQCWESHVHDSSFVNVFASLKEKGLDLNYRTMRDRWTALMVVSGSVQYRAGDVRKLLELGCRPAVVDAEGWTALHWAAYHACAFAITAICAGFGVHDGGSGPCGGRAELAALLALKDSKGRTALDVARERDNGAEAAALAAAVVAASVPGVTVPGGEAR